MTKFSYEDALSQSVIYFNGDDLAAKVWLDKYALRDDSGNILEDTPTAMHRRVAKELARVESKKFNRPYSEDYIFSLMDKFKYVVPQGSILYGCGNPYSITSLSNCYVVESPCDSYGGILRADQHLVQISKRRGGVGIDLSKLRPKGSSTKNAARSSTGIVSWMERYSNSIREVGQDGRRGALMLTLSVHHPDILDFITIKNDPAKVTGANISVRLTNEFLSAVEKDEEYEVRFPVNSKNVVGKIKAKLVWDTIIHSAWLRAEPGLLFWDDIVNYNAVDCYGDVGFETVSTNPCSELPLCYNDSCRLLLLNLFSYVSNPFTDNVKFDHKLFYEHSKVAQRLMDDIIDLELEKIDGILQKILEDPEQNTIKEEEYNLWCGIKKKCIDGRRTGLGITALGDTLAALGFKYDEDNALIAVDAIFKNLKLAALESSCNMAEELGPFAVWDWNKEKESMFLLQVKAERPELYEAISKYGRRNIGHLTVAPTGSMSILTQTTSGVEPLFRLNPYIRRKKINPGDKNSKVDFVDQNGDSWQNFEVYHPRVEQWMKVTKKSNLEDSPWFGCCAEDIDWQQRVKLQGVIQRHIDHAISSTINLPETVTESEVSTIYMEAWKNRLKGVTVYRNNCRTGVLVDKAEPKQGKKRPKKLKCHIYHPSVKGVKYYAAVGLKEDGLPYEIFVGNNGIDSKSSEGFIQRIKEGRYSLISDNEIVIEDMCEQCSDEEEAIARLASIALRNNVEIQAIVEQLEKTKGSLSGFAKVICRILRKYIPEQTKSNDKCTECGNNLVYQEGCKKCLNCGYSKC
jgi:ribonucleoside-diphosphate reductase alpha chain